MPDDRYSTITREVPVDRPRNTVYAATGGASGELNSQHRVTEHPAGFRVRERGAIDATVVHAYRCPVHGLVDMRVARGDVPDVMPCPLVSVSVAGFDAEHADRAAAEESCRERGIGLDEVRLESQRCADDMTWAGSSCGIGHSAGEVTS